MRKCTICNRLTEKQSCCKVKTLSYIGSVTADFEASSWDDEFEDYLDADYEYDESSNIDAILMSEDAYRALCVILNDALMQENYELILFCGQMLGEHAQALLSAIGQPDIELADLAKIPQLHKPYREMVTKSNYK